MTTTFVSIKQQIDDFVSSMGNNILCNKDATTDEEIIRILSDIAGDVAHTTNDGHMIYKKSGIFYKFVKPDKSVFEDNISVTDAALLAKQNIEFISSSGVFSEICGFTSDKLPSLTYKILDKPVRIKLSPQFKLFEITNKGSGQYLDFVGWFKSRSLINYSMRTGRSLIHSGDRSFASYFMHSITINTTSQQAHEDFVLGGVGFSKTPLISPTFTNQKPTMLCYDPEHHIVYIIPFKQTMAILGPSNTALAAAVIQFERDFVKITPTTIVSDRGCQYNTCDRPTCGMIERAFKFAEEYVEETEDVSGGGGSAEVTTEEEYDIVSHPGEDELNSVLYVSTSKSDKMSVDCSVMDYEGNMKVLGNNFNPAVFGVSKPNVYNGSISPSDTKIEHFKSKLNAVELLILKFSVSDVSKFPEECAKLVKLDDKVTCLMILDVKFDDKSDILNTLENTKLSCASYANQYSIVLARCVDTNTYYWIRGIRWFHENVYEYGDVFDKFDSIFETIKTKKLPFPIKANNTLYVDGRFITQEEFNDLISTKTIDELSHKQMDLIEAFVQMSVIVPKGKFNELKMSCIKKLKMQQEKDQTTDKRLLRDLTLKLFNGDKSKNVIKMIEELKSSLKKGGVHKKLDKLVKIISGMTAEGGVSTKAASKSLDNTIRSDLTKNNVEKVEAMTLDDLYDYLGEIDSFVVGDFKLGDSMMRMLDKVADSSFGEPESDIAVIHDTCSELDGLTVAALGQQVETNDISHPFRGSGLSILCGHATRNSSVPIAILDVFSDMKDPRHFKWIDRSLDEEISKYRILLRKMIISAFTNRDRQISPGSITLTKFLVAMFMSIAKSIRSKFTSIPTDETDFTVKAMRTLIGFAFTSLACGAEPASYIWQVLSHYPVEVPTMKAFEVDELWIVEGLIDMFPYCLWTKAEANFKKNTLCGIIKMLSKYVITPDLKKIAEQEKLALAEKTNEIAKDLTIVWQWQKLVIMSILKILYKCEDEEKEEYSIDIVKSAAKKLLESYPDIDEQLISFNHKNSNSSEKLKKILSQMMSKGKIILNAKQDKTIRDIMSKRMHPYYYHMSKSARIEFFSKLTYTELLGECAKAQKIKKSGPSSKWEKSWSFGKLSTTTTFKQTQEDVKSILSLGDSESKSTEGGSALAVIESKEIVPQTMFSDMREEKWIMLNDSSKIVKFLETNEIIRVVSILTYVFSDKSSEEVTDIIIDICKVLLTEYKDRAKAYEILLKKYRF